MKLPWRKGNWVHYTFRRVTWPAGVYSWTYSRVSHPFMWLVFGNDLDGCIPPVYDFNTKSWTDKQWSWLGWWIRNTMANFKYCIIGLAAWKEGQVGDSAWPAPLDLERKFWKGSMEILQNGHGFILSGIRRKGAKIWRPYIRIPLPFKLAFWWGWKPTRGQLCCSLKRVR